MALNNSINAPVVVHADGFSIAGGTTNKRTFDVSGANVTVVGSGSATITFPSSSATLATLALSENLTNKTLDTTNTITLKDTLFTLQDDGDLTKQLQFQLSGITAGNTRTVTIPDASGTLAYSTTTTFSPTVTLVGGAGNTTPVYSTNTGRYTRTGSIVFVDVYLTGDGGNEGAGTGQINIALPVTASASHPTSLFPVGYVLNGTTEDDVFGQIIGSGTTITLNYFNLVQTTVALTGADQNNVTRTVRLKFFYEV